MWVSRCSHPAAAWNSPKRKEEQHERAGTKLGVGTHFRLDGETVEIVEFASLATGVVLNDVRDRLARMSLRELLTSDRAELIHDKLGPSPTGDGDLAAVVPNRLTEDEKKDVLEWAEHVREMLTGYRSGAFREHDEAGLVPKAPRSEGGWGNADPRSVEAAVAVLSEYEEESRPSVKVVLEEVEARLKTKFKLVKFRCRRGRRLIGGCRSWSGATRRSG